MGEAVEFFANGFSKNCDETNQLDSLHNCSWYEEVIDDDLKWSFAVKRFVKKFSVYHQISPTMNAIRSQTLEERIPEAMLEINHQYFHIVIYITLLFFNNCSFFDRC